jgi:hypothetical protein
LHATHNAFIQWILDPMTNSTAGGTWYAGEFGMSLAITTGIVAVALMALRPLGQTASSRQHGPRA